MTDSFLSYGSGDVTDTSINTYDIFQGSSATHVHTIYIVNIFGGRQFSYGLLTLQIRSIFNDYAKRYFPREIFTCIIC